MADDGGFVSFKGVMLCSRPPAVAAPPPRIDEGMVKMLNRPAFVSTIQIESAVGLPPIRQERPVSVAKPKASDVTYRHKKWLMRFQENHSALNEMLRAKADKLEDSKRRLASKAAEERTAIRAINATDGLSDAERTRRIAEVVDPRNKAGEPAYEPTAAPATAAAAPAAASSSSSSASASASASAPVQRHWVRRARAAKPAWAMSIEESEEAQDAEADELLNFAAGLDFDRYVEDVEVRESLRFARKRVRDAELEHAREALAAEAAQRKAAARARGEVGDDDDEFEWLEVDEHGLTAEEALIKRRREFLARGGRATPMDHTQGWDSSTRVGDGRAGARTPLVTDLKMGRPGLGKIHSDASLRSVADRMALAQTAASGVAAGVTVGPDGRRYLPEPDPVPGEAIKPPRIVVISPTDGTVMTEANSAQTRKALKEQRVSNLPYLYRNPSI